LIRSPSALSDQSAHAGFESLDAVPLNKTRYSKNGSPRLEH
jgi:hypothetical protein